MKINEEIKKYIEDSEEKIIITPKCKILQGSEIDIFALLVELLNIISTKSGKENIDKLLKDYIDGEFERYIEKNKEMGLFSVHDLEEVEEILDEEEKEYLKAVIKPFKNYVNYIGKFRNIYSDKENIRISVKKEYNEELIEFPYFNIDSMYKNMKSNKKYNLKELDLF